VVWSALHSKLPVSTASHCVSDAVRSCNTHVSNRAAPLALVHYLFYSSRSYSIRFEAAHAEDTLCSLLPV